MAENRTTRDHDTREKTSRPKSWAPPNLLPDPDPEPGYAFRWIRTATLGQSDPMNVSSKLREGWEPVKASDHPEVMLFADAKSGKDNIEVGGLMLCKTPTEFVDQRDSYYTKQAEAQMQSVDNNFMRENDPRMPLLAPERKTEVKKFGKGF